MFKGALKEAIKKIKDSEKRTNLLRSADRADLLETGKTPLNTCIKNMESQIIRSLETKKQIETIAKRTSRRSGYWKMDKYDTRLW